MKVLLVYPKYPISFWGFQHSLTFIGCKAALPPLPLLTVAAMFPKGWEVKLIDENIERLTDGHMAWADVVFVSAMIAQKESATRILLRCRELNKKTVVGGPMVSADSNSCGGLADCLLLGEAEVALPTLLRDLSKGTEFLKPIYKVEKFCDMEDSPTPWFALLGGNLKKYSSMAMQFSRGCPHDCDFCSVTALCGKKMRVKSAVQILTELSVLKKIGWRGSIFIVDDNFIGNKRKAKKLLLEIINWQQKNNYPFHFYTQASLKISEDEELLGLMVQAGFRRV